MIEQILQGVASPAAGTSVVNAVTGYTVISNTKVYFVVYNLGTASTGVSGLGATWTRIVNVVGTGVGVEVWQGIGATAAGNVTTTFALSTKASYHWLVVDWEGTVVAGTPVTATGNSVTVDPGTVVPAVKDLVLYAQCHANITVPSANTDTPGTPQTYVGSQANSPATATSGTLAWKEATSTTATKRTSTITSGQWVAAMVAITPTITASTGDLVDENIALSDIEPFDGRAYRGQDTAALDDAGAY